jgi:hypothetical protein
MMKQERIQDLLADYYEGNTSREEEALLMDFFLHSDVPEVMEADRMLFLSFADAANEVIPDKDFDEKLISLLTKPEEKSGIVKMKRFIFAATGIAASFLLLIGIYFFIADRQSDVAISEYSEYSIDEAQIAYEEARNALLLVSHVMNTGTRELEPLSKITDATDELSVMNRFYYGTRELQTFSVFEEIKDKITEQ